MQTALNETQQIVRNRLNSRFRLVLSGLTTEMYRPWSLALARYRFSSWPAVCLRTTHVVAISKSDILLFPLFSRSYYSPLHCTSFPRSIFLFIFILYIVFLSPSLFGPRIDSIPYAVAVDQFVKRLMLEVSDT